MQVWRELVHASLWAMAIVFMSARDLPAETIETALAKAYRDNPQLNAQRALVRVTDEYVPQALSGYRPRISVTASGGQEYGSLTVTGPNPTNPAAPPISTTSTQALTPYNYGITATQTLFNGFQTTNRTRAAESQVQAAREGLRVIEQTVLLNAATIYMDVLRDTGAVQIQQSNVTALRQVLEQTRKRFSRGDVTATDVSQSQTQLAAGELALLAAEATLATSRANYLSIIGAPPQDLHPGTPVDRYVPGNLNAAIDVALIQNPNITAAMYGIDVAYLQVKINEGALFPTVSVQGIVQQNYLPAPGETGLFNAGLIGQLALPLYQGGAEYSLIRQSKESLGQQRLNLDLVRRQIRASVTQARAQLEAARGELQKAKQEVSAAEAAVNGILKEITVGERTTLDLLITQQNLVSARTALITAQHDRVVASYNLLAAIGRLSPSVLALPTPIYDARVHYQQVRDAWGGLRAPSGE